MAERASSPDGPNIPIPFLDLRAAYAELASELDAACARVLSSGFYILGSELEAFETEFAAYCGVAHAVGVGNGLDALALILRAHGIGPGDEVIVPTHTFVATWLAVTQVGARVCPVEVDPCTFNLDPGRLEEALSARTRAVIAVHLYGLPAEMDPICAFARRHGLVVIEDAAQAHGARYQGRRTGSLAQAAAFSFYPAKNLGAMGDGGAITTSDPHLAEKLRTLRNYGSVRKYHHEEVGCNSRLDELQAAFLRVRLRHLDRWNERRAKIAHVYTQALGATGLILPEVPTGAESVWHLYVVRHDARDALREYLAHRRIGTLEHYPIPLHRSGAYAHLGLQAERFPIAEQLSRQVLSLPMGPHLSLADAEIVARAICEWPALAP